MRALGFALYVRRHRKSSAPEFKPTGKAPRNFARNTAQGQQDNDNIEAYFPQDIVDNDIAIAPGVNARDLIQEVQNVLPAVAEEQKRKASQDRLAERVTDRAPSRKTPVAQRKRKSPIPIDLLKEVFQNVRNTGPSNSQKQFGNRSGSSSVQPSPPRSRRRSLSHLEVQNKYENKRKQVLKEAYEPSQGDPVHMELFKKNRVGIPYFAPGANREQKLPNIPEGQDPTSDPRRTPLDRAFHYNRATKKFRPYKVLGRVIEVHYPARIPDNQLREFYTEMTQAQADQVKQHFRKLRSRAYDSRGTYFIEQPRTFEIINTAIYSFVPFQLIIDVLVEEGGSTNQNLRAAVGYATFFRSADQASYSFYKRTSETEVKEFFKFAKSEFKEAMQSDKEPEEVLEDISSQLSQFKADFIQQFFYLYDKVGEITTKYEELIAMVMKYVVERLAVTHMRLMKLNQNQEAGLEVTAKEMFKMSYEHFKRFLLTGLDQTPSCPNFLQQDIEDQLKTAYTYTQREDVLKRALQLVNSKALSLMIFYLIF